MPKKKPGTAAEQTRNDTNKKEIKEGSFRIWSQFELDLIHCIKYEHPCIYKFQEKTWSTAKRKEILENAWAQIKDHLGLRFENISVYSIKSRWKNIRDRHNKLKRESVDKSVISESKYLDGTLNFLDEIIFFDDEDDDTDMVFENQSIDGENLYKSLGSSTDTSALSAHTVIMNESVKDDQPLIHTSSDSNIRQLIHEEFDIPVDSNDIKQELDADADDPDDNNYIEALEKNIYPNNYDKEEKAIKIEDQPPKKWDEEELLNATRLTKEMIDELILIKTRSSNLSSVTSSNNQ